MSEVRFSKSKKLLPIADSPGRAQAPSTELSSSKTENMLRARVRLLQKQIQILQSNINMFAPLTDKNPNDSNIQKPYCVQHEQTIKTLNAKIIKLEQDKLALQASKSILEKEKQAMGQQLRRQQEQLDSLIKSLKDMSDKCRSLEQTNHLLTLQVKFSKKELEETMENLAGLKKTHSSLLEKIRSIENNSMVELALKENLIIIKSEQYAALKKDIFDLRKKLALKECQDQWKKDEQQWQKRKEKAELGIPCKDIAEEIVRLKKNIDLQLGNSESQYSAAFVSKYRELESTLEALSKK